MVSGCVASVEGKEIVGKIVVVTVTRHSQGMNDPVVNIWIIAEKEGNIISGYCSGCKAGLKSYSHVASVTCYKSAQKINLPFLTKYHRLVPNLRCFIRKMALDTKPAFSTANFRRTTSNTF